MAKARWNLLIKHLKKRGDIKTGVTIPYLYGAYKRLGYDINNIEDLLIAILNEPSKDEFPVIEKCDVIKFDVIKIEDKSFVNKTRKKEVKINTEDSAGILVISYNTNLGKDIKKLSASLVGLYQKQIDDETFSWSNKEKRWKKFDDSDYEKIDSVK